MIRAYKQSQGIQQPIKTGDLWQQIDQKHSKILRNKIENLKKIIDALIINQRSDLMQLKLDMMENNKKVVK